MLTLFKVVKNKYDAKLNLLRKSTNLVQIKYSFDRHELRRKAMGKTGQENPASEVVLQVYCWWDLIFPKVSYEPTETTFILLVIPQYPFSCVFNFTVDQTLV